MRYFWKVGSWIFLVYVCLLCLSYIFCNFKLVYLHLKFQIHKSSCHRFLRTKFDSVYYEKICSRSAYQSKVWFPFPNYQRIYFLLLLALCSFDARINKKKHINVCFVNFSCFEWTQRQFSSYTCPIPLKAQDSRSSGPNPSEPNTTSRPNGTFQFPRIGSLFKNILT